MDTRDINKRVIEQFRAGGEITGMHRDRLLLLTTTGATTGRQRTTPMMYHADGTRILVVASANGAEHNPAWYHNVKAHPMVTVEVADDTYEAMATVPSGTERDTLWAELTEIYPFFREHAERAGREIPVVVLTRAAP